MAAAMLMVSASAGTDRQQPMTNDRAESWSFRAVSRPSDHRSLAFSLRGMIAHTIVKAGDEITRGQVLVKLEDSVQSLTVELAKLQAEDMSDIDNAKRTMAFREEDLKYTRESSQQGGANEKELRNAVFQADLAKIDYESVMRGMQQRRVSLAREKARLDEMQIVSPIDGVVVEVLKQAGETADEQSPVVSIVAVDPLWLDVSVPTARAMELSVGDTAQIHWEEVDALPEMEGTIIFRSPVAHGGAREMLVRLVVANPDSIPSGLHAKVTFRGSK